jgi:DNA polymerase III subunit beta
MKFVASSTTLLNHLQAISRVINSKNTMQILDNFLFKLEGNTLTLTASDLETTMITSLEVVDVEGEGSLAVAAKLLLDTLREFSEQPLTFDVNDENLALVITSENGQYNFIGQNADEYPLIPKLSETANSLKIDAATLNEGIQTTFFATADDELRPVMNGIFFDVKSECTTIVATDAHKLVRYQNENVTGDGAYSFILAKKAAGLLKNILPKETGDVTIRFDEKNLCFTLRNYTLFARQIEGRYPNYAGVIPVNNPYKVIADRPTLLNAIRRVSVFSNQGTSLVKLQIENNQIVISAQDIDFSISAEEKIACQFEADAPIVIGFKSSFLIDILTNLSSNEVVLELSDPSRAGLFLPFEQAEGENLLMLLMPMLLNN